MFSINQLRLIGFHFLWEGEIFWFVNPSGIRQFVIDEEFDFNEVIFELLENETLKPIKHYAGF
jgi:hypothetical protein